MDNFYTNIIKTGRKSATVLKKGIDNVPAYTEKYLKTKIKPYRLQHMKRPIAHASHCTRLKLQRRAILNTYYKNGFQTYSVLQILIQKVF